MPSSDPALFSLLQAYSALSTPGSYLHDFLLSSVLLNSHLLQYPPSHTYQLSFWKWAIEHLEKLLGDEEGAEIDERMYDRLVSLVTISKPVAHDVAAPPPPSFVTHYWEPAPQSGPPSRTTIESGTTGLRTWRASFVLAQFLIQNPTILVNKSVLELGSGTGFLGLIVADIQVSSGGVTRQPVLYLTDVNEDVLRRCHENTQLPCSRLAACVVEAQLSYSRRISPPRKFICQITGLV
ncbi:hypothetical protein BGY98DRAFT_958524, partial [Russula aff. rugulosa BPL654]